MIMRQRGFTSRRGQPVYGRHAVVAGGKIRSAPQLFPRLQAWHRKRCLAAICTACALKKARRLLRQGKSIAEAAAAGYADQSRLHRMFVKFYSVTPGCYRKGASHSCKK